ncbi:hypothetical protein C8R44DRAFT_861409 [Mycena epipterygia]|nr:hypothetical protein C8R44DRAFT_861409 [Mycena epipterygia]
MAAEQKRIPTCPKATLPALITLSVRNDHNSTYSASSWFFSSLPSLYNPNSLQGLAPTTRPPTPNRPQQHSDINMSTTSTPLTPIFTTLLAPASTTRLEIAGLRAIITDDPHTWDQASPLRYNPAKWHSRPGARWSRYGAGDDARLIASPFGLDTSSIDISPLAVEHAVKNIPEDLKSKPTSRSAISSRSACPIPARSSISYTTAPLITFTYTFFAGIPPSQCPAWGTQTNALLIPGGYLIALKFPLDPWFVPRSTRFTQPRPRVGEGPRPGARVLESGRCGEQIVAWRKL